MRPRFIVELCILAILMLWLPARFMRRYIRRRCADLGADVPSARDEFAVSWRVGGGVLAFACLALAACMLSSEFWMSVKVAVAALAIGLIVWVSWYAERRRARYGLYYGTLARSLAPVYAFSIIFISLTLQPYQLYSEAMWLRRDTTIYGYLADPRSRVAGFTSIETKASRAYARSLRKAVGEGGE